MYVLPSAHAQGLVTVVARGQRRLGRGTGKCRQNWRFPQNPHNAYLENVIRSLTAAEKHFFSV